MTNIVKIKEGNVTFIHHSTASVVQIIVDNPAEEKASLFFDYFEWESLVKIVNQIEQDKTK